MIDPSLEKIYDIILSIFLGIVLVIMFDQLFDKPRIVNIFKN